MFTGNVNFYEGAIELEQFWHSGLTPDPNLQVSEWADQYRILSAKSAAESGHWRTSRAPYLKEPMDCLSPSSPVKRVAWMKGSQVGAPLALDTPIPTVDGWTTMGDIQVGDWVFDEAGQPCRVNGVSPVLENRECYKVSFEDHETIVCDAHHQWPVWDYSNKRKTRKTLRTNQMFGKTLLNKGGSKRYSIDVCKPIELPERDLLIHPYVLGLWLGDGNSIMNHISVHEDDAELAEYIEACGYEAIFRLPTWRKGKCANIVINPTVRLQEKFEKEGHANFKQHSSSFIQTLRLLDVLDNKHIPSEYLRASFEQRIALIQGLMDSDGCILKNARCEFGNTNRQLIDGMLELLRGIGLKPNIWQIKGKEIQFPQGHISRSRPCWKVSWMTYREQPMFRLKRKIQRMRPVSQGRPYQTKYRRIVNIEKTESVPVRCIEVGSPNHLFLCGRSWVPTHNTEAGINFIGFVVHMAPGPMLAVAPTVELAKRNSRQRIDPLINDVPEIAERIAPARSRDSGNTVLSKEFPGGVLVMTGANSAVGLRSMPARYIFMDEIDGYPTDVDGEGDPILLAERRSATFARSRKIFLVSTPTIKSTSRIDREFQHSDQRYYFVPCPHCGEYQILEFGQLNWIEGKPETTTYVCKHCEQKISERYKTEMLAKGQWRPTKESDGHTRGYHLSSLYSPVGWFSWAEAARMYEEAQEHPDLMKGFVNTVLGEPFEEEFEAPEWERLYERRESYAISVVPEGGLFLTAGVDIQRDRIECEIVAWGRDKESWSVDYHVLGGDTAQADVWNKLERILNKDWPHAGGGTMPIRVMAVDSGYATQEVYNWVRKFPQAVWGGAGARSSQPRTVIAIKGRDADTALILSVSKADTGGKRRGLRVWNVSGPVAKVELYRWLKLPRPTDEELKENSNQYPPGTCHFPQYGEEYFKQLTAEKRVVRLHKGFPKSSWEKDPTRNNEALDCRVYARAAASVYGLDRFKEIQWKRLEVVLGKSDEAIIKNNHESKTNETTTKSKTNQIVEIKRRMPTKAEDPYL